MKNIKSLSLFAIAVVAVFGVMVGFTNAQVIGADASVTIVGSPTLELTYDANRSESVLTGVFNLSVTAGRSDLYLYTDMASASLLDTNGRQGPASVNVDIAAGEKSDKYGRNYTQVAASGTVRMIVTLTANPKQLFAGSYHGFLSNLYVFGSDVDHVANLSVPSNHTNEKVIIGEVSPYITGFGSSQPFRPGQFVVAQGQRLDTSGGIFIDGVFITSGAKGDSTSIGFALPTSLTNGYHTLQIKSNTTGASNNVGFQITDGSVQAGSSALVTPGTLALTYNTSGKEAALTAPFVVTVTAGSNDITFTSGSFVAMYTGKAAQQNVPTTVQYINKQPFMFPYVLKSGQKADFYVVASADPLKMFAGSYTMSLYGVYPTKNNGTEKESVAINSNNTNSVVIVGEVSPYITSVTPNPISVGQKMALSGQRLIGAMGRGNLYIDNLAITAPVDGSKDGTTLFFTLPSLTDGYHTLFVRDNVNGTGASNNVSFQVQSGTQCYVFTTNLQLGSRGADVVALQTFLIGKGFPISDLGLGGAKDKGLFGRGTYEALKLYQASVGIPATGFLGPLTRASINGDCNNGGPVPVGPSITSISPSSGGSGTLVTIYGNNFQKGNYVRVSGKGFDQRMIPNTSPNSSSATVMVFYMPTLPAETGVYDIQVGYGDTLSNGVQFNAGSVTTPPINITSPDGQDLQTNFQYKIIWTDSREKGVSPVYVITMAGSNGKDLIANSVPASTYCQGSTCYFGWNPTTPSTNNQISIYDVANDPNGAIVGRSKYFNIVTSVIPTTNLRESVRQLYLTLLHREPEQQGWDYWVNTGMSIDQIKSGIIGGIEYTTKQKIAQIFQDVLGRQPNDLEYMKWYYLTEYNGWNTDIVRQGLGGTSPTPVTPPTTYTCPVGYVCTPTTPVITPIIPTPIVTPAITSEQVKCVFNGSSNQEKCYTATSSTAPDWFTCTGVGTCVVDVKGFTNTQLTWKSSCAGDKLPITTIDGNSEYANFTCSIVPPPAVFPTATFTVEGQHSYTYVPGQTNHIKWSSTNADSFSSYATATAGGTVCGGGPWVANNASGDSSTYLVSSYAGCVWTITYTARNSSTGQSASDTIVVSVTPPATVPKTQLNTSASMLTSAIWDAVREYMQAIPTR